MNISVTSNQKSEKADEAKNIRMEDGDNSVLSTAGLDFSQILQGRISDINVNREENLPDIDFTYDITMDINDAMFFVNLIHEGQFSVQSVQGGDFQNLIKTEAVQNTIIQKTVSVTNDLSMLIEKAQSTQKPVRISFSNDVSVVLKIDKQGKVTAEFIPGSIEAENYLMNNIQSLKQKFDEQNLPYNSLSYRQNSRRNSNKRNRNEA